MGTNRHESTINFFLALVRTGLWEQADSNHNLDDILNDKVDWDEVYKMAVEQSVHGLVLQGIERLRNHNVKLDLNQGLLLQWIGEVQMIEQRNKNMNAFLTDLIEKLRKHDINTLLVKGQGIAQCYERPLWRSCGDVDLFLSDDNYNRAKELLVPIASEVEKEYVREKHLGMTINGFVVELHGSLRMGLPKRINQMLNDIEMDAFYNGNVRSWMNGETQIFMLGKENDIVYVFVHFFNHFYKEGVGLRQVCDWCRLLWTYRDSLNHKLIESRIRQAGLMSEWKAFGAFAVEYLGMPIESMPFLNANDNLKLKKKAKRICDFIMKVGNMGHNRDMSHFGKYPYLVRKCVSMGRRIGDLINHARIFPLDSLRFFPRIMFNGVRSAVRGE